MCNLREEFVNLREGFVEAPWRLREAFSKTRSAKASRRRHGRLHLETIRQIMTSPQIGRNPVSRHQIEPEYEDDGQADAGRDGRTCLARPNLGREQGQGNKYLSP